VDFQSLSPNVFENTSKTLEGAFFVFFFDGVVEWTFCNFFLVGFFFFFLVGRPLMFMVRVARCWFVWLIAEGDFD